ncbi:ribosomal-processing cysteine protease Prp [Paenibacillus sp. FSL H8-0537]|uniref:ribosomal-processing cysteine protease Prp n=1 Tax=Paenibacillus sp. FSL H8-0537 TaxID=2921399 RepID=UPI0031016D08
MEHDDINIRMDRQRDILAEEHRDPFVITFFTFANQDIYGFVAKGSTGFSKYGLDIIAAAVSTLTINAVNSINEFTDDSPEVDMGRNYMKCIIHEKVSRDSQILLRSLRLGMEDIQRSYGEQYLVIEEIRVGKS